jgi:hypothetical protein
MPPKPKRYFVARVKLPKQTKADIDAARAAAISEARARAYARQAALQADLRERALGAAAGAAGVVAPVAQQIAQRAAGAVYHGAPAIARGVYHGVPAIARGAYRGAVGAMDVAEGVGRAASITARTLGSVARTVGDVGQRGYRAGAWTLRQGRAINRRLEELGVAPSDAARFIGRSAYEMGRSGIAVGTAAYRHATEAARFLREHALQQQHERNIHAQVRAGLATGALTPAEG